MGKGLASRTRRAGSRHRGLCPRHDAISSSPSHSAKTFLTIFSKLIFWGTNMTTNTRREFLKQAAIGAAALAAYQPPTVLGANDRVRVGMIGVGGRGTELLKEVLQVPNVQLVAMADVYSHRRDAAKQMAPGIQACEDHRRLLDMKELDGVIVASPLHTRARHFVDTINAGKDLYCEKTMTWSIPEAEQCLATAKKSDRVVQIGLQRESSGSLADTRKWIK